MTAAHGPAITFTLPLPPRGLRRNHEAHRFAANKLKDEYSFAVSALVAEAVSKQWPRSMGSLTGPLSVSVEWRQTGKGDVDNALANCKPLLDILGKAPVTKAGANRWYCGLYESDSQIEEITVRRTQVKHKADEGVLVTILKGEA